MNKKFTKLLAAFALLCLFSTPAVGWGQNTYTIGWGTATGTAGTYTNFTETSGSVSGILSFSTAKNGSSNAPAYNSNNSELRLYYHSGGNGGSITITPAQGITITGAVMTTSTSPSVKYTVDGGTATSVSASNNTYTVSGISATQSLKFQNVNTSNTQLRILTIAVTYSITYTVTYDCNGGTNGCPSNVTSIAPGSVINLADAPSKTGHAFDGWSDGTSTYEAGSPYTVNNDVTMTAQWTAYDITAQSNNASYGTVSLDGFIITASPAAGCRYASPAYSVLPANSATVAQSGNTFTVTPTANTTVTINFEVIPTHTATFSVNGTTTSSQSYAEGAAITFPANNPADIDGKTFVGWTTAAIDGTTDEAPTMVNSATMGDSNVTFYAVFASVTPGTATTVTDVLTRATTGVTNGTTTYSSWSGKTSNSDAVYAGNSAGGNNSIQLRSNNSNSGVVTTTSGGKAKKVTITWNSNTSNGRILDIYGKNSAYSAASELYTNNQGTKLGSVTYGGNSTVVTITDDYNFIGMRSNEGAMYISSISIEWESVSPDTYSGYCTTVIIPTVAKPTFSQASGEVVDGTVVTMSCTTEGATIYYSTDDGASWTEGNTYTITENVTLKAKAVNGSDESQVVEATYTVQYILTVNMEHVEYFIFNYHDATWDNFPVDAEGRPLVHAGDNVRVSVASVEDCYTLQGLSVTFGETTIVPEYLEDEEYSFIMPASSAMLIASVNSSTEYTLTVAGLEYASFTQLLVGSESDEVDLNNNNQANICEQLHVAMIGLTATTGHVLESVTLTYGGQTTEITPESGVYEFTMPSSNATLTITTYEVALFTYTKVTSVTPGKHYIIVTESDDNQEKYHAMGGNNSTGSNPYMNPVEVNVDNNTVTVAENEGVAEILIDGTEDHYTLHTSEGYLAGGEKMLDINGTVESTWGISFDGDQAVITWSNTNYAIQYNSSNPRFACYSSSQAKVCLYEKNEPATETYELPITGYNDGGGWNLIASPVATPITPTTQNGFITDNNGSNATSETATYDLYSFNQSANKEWVNYRQHQLDFSIESGTGYLYASKNGTTLTFTGMPYNGDGVVELDYTQEADFAGWNLVGNPFNAEVSVDQDFYVMNGTGSEIIAAGANRTTVAPMEGIFVKATEPGLMVTFTIPEGAANNNSQSSLSINLTNTSTRSASVIDRAIVRFNGNTLPKFQLFENSTKLYIPQGTEDYAIVSSEAQGEMPVNFRANENGTYTLTVNPENVDMNYLHLIDNMTGNDIDLLMTPSYSFNATTNDYESRFRLVFAANASTDSETDAPFAFMSDGNWIINNAGEATLQVIDLNGRILSSERVNGSVSKTINATPGVYMLHLINGENVMVQKIVVR